MICQKEDIIFIHGDVVEVYFNMDNIDPAAIKNVYLTCAAQGLFVQCTYSNLQNKYCFRLGSDFTSSLKPKIATYDLTVELIDGNIITAIHNSGFVVLKRKNKALEEEK